MSTRRERANRWWLRCPQCKEWKANHYVHGIGYLCDRPTTEKDKTP